MRMQLGIVAFIMLLVTATPVAAGPDDDVRAVVERFVAAQNAHDARAVGDLLWDSAHFLWITRGTAVWGRQPALARFETLYRGTWLLEPAMQELRITLLNDRTAQIYVPMVFTIGPEGQPAQKVRFLMTQVLIKTPAGWKVASILPIPAPVP